MALGTDNAAPLIPGGIFNPIANGGDVPEGALAHFSFAMGTYWTEADGDLTAEDVLTDTSSIESGVGYTGGAAMVPLAAAALAALSTNMTLVMRGRLITTNPEQGSDTGVDMLSIADSSDYNSGGGFSVKYTWDEALGSVTRCQGWGNVYDTGQPYNEITLPDIPAGTDPEARFDSAYTLTPTKFSVSSLGGAAVSEAITISFSLGWAELQSAASMVAANAHFALESMTVYPVQADAALPALSTPL